MFTNDKNLLSLDYYTTRKYMFNLIRTDVILNVRQIN